jgi:DNA (cytosine-5)-methyltransferase 1
MAWSYERLWILLLKKKLKRTDLLTIAKINTNALARMGKDLPVTMDNLGKICHAFNCRLEEIVEYVDDAGEE